MSKIEYYIELAFDYSGNEELKKATRLILPVIFKVSSEKSRNNLISIFQKSIDSIPQYTFCYNDLTTQIISFSPEKVSDNIGNLQRVKNHISILFNFPNDKSNTPHKNQKHKTFVINEIDEDNLIQINNQYSQPPIQFNVYYGLKTVDIINNQLPVVSII